jgi:hypothetical protein
VGLSTIFQRRKTVPDTKKLVSIMFALMATFAFAGTAKAEDDDSEYRGDMARHQKKAEIVMSVFADGQEPGGALTLAGEVYKYKMIELLLGLKTEFAQTELEAPRLTGGKINGYTLGLYAVLGLKINIVKWLSFTVDFGGGMVYDHTPEFIWEQTSDGYVRGVNAGNFVTGGLTWGATLMFKIGRFGIGPGYLGGVAFNAPLGWEEWDPAKQIDLGLRHYYHFTVNGSVEF